MILNCPHCCKEITLAITSPRKVVLEDKLRGADLLNFYIKSSKMNIKTIGKLLGINPGTVSNLRLRRTGIGLRNAIRIATAFGHSDYHDFLCPRRK